MIKYLAKKLFAPATPAAAYSPKVVTFKDIAGNPKAMEGMKTFCHYVKCFNQPDSPYEEYGLQPGGMLFYGLPGTGKTIAAQALAGETGCPFVAIKISEVSNVFGGTGPNAIRQAFDDAKALAEKAKKPCILFIDEVDSIGVRGHSAYGLGDENDKVIASLLIRIGTEEFKNIHVIMATNRRDDLDEALKRSGRIDTEIEFQLPTEDERFDILKIHAQFENDHQGDRMLRKVAQATDGFTGADLKNLVGKAKIAAIQHGRSIPLALLLVDFTQAIAEIKEKKPPSARPRFYNAPQADFAQQLFTVEQVGLLATLFRATMPRGAHEQ